MKYLRFFPLVVFFAFCSCSKDCCEVPECNINLSGAVVSVYDGVSGGSGTLISDDELDSLSITSSSATIKYSIVKVGTCNKILGYGHTWSSVNATPVLGIDNYSDYGENVNFNDEAVTLLSNLQPNTRYWVRSWIAVEQQNCTRERVTFYNDHITEFVTLP